MIRTLIVDDEPLARERLRTLLEQEADIQILGECSDGRQAVLLITEQAPDLVFLDIQMPGLDGFGVLQAITDRPLPAVIFVTAYDQYALQAFEVHALDYLLKPFTARRFQKALQRARQDARPEPGGDDQQHPVERRLLNLLDDLGGERRFTKRIVVKSSGRIHFVKVDEIDWVEAEGNYVRLHIGAHSHLLRETMKGMEAALDPEKFIRIHRSTIVNTERIRELQPLFHGEYAVMLYDGTRLVASRGPENRLRKMLDVAMVK
jgi:two-component system, LytTR family, response regulator